MVYIKGAPEKVASLCKPETSNIYIGYLFKIKIFICHYFSVPVDFASTLHWYTRQGLRVLAAATKNLGNETWKTVDDMSRSELEEKADFLGLIVMQNLVKDETYGAIKELHEADINTVMVTGDNILTAISVGRDCDLVRPDQTIIRVEADPVIDPTHHSQRLNVSYNLEENEKSNIVHDVSLDKLDSKPSQSRHHLFFQSNFIRSVQDQNYVFACDGRTFDLIRNHDRALLDRIVQRGKIFARMLPEQKIQLIECMKDLG